MSVVSAGPLGSKKDILYIYVSINHKPLVEYQTKTANIREAALKEVKSLKKGRYVLDGSQ
jgi:hypothetical protein